MLAARADDGRPTALLLVSLIPANAEGASTIGDAALAAVGEAISRNTRGGDFVGRYAEREFVVLLPDTNPDEGAVTMARLREVVATALRRSSVEGLPATVELSASVAPEHGTTSGALLAAADASMRRRRGVARPMAPRVLVTAA